MLDDKRFLLAYLFTVLIFFILEYAPTYEKKLTVSQFTVPLDFIILSCARFNFIFCSFWP